MEKVLLDKLPPGAVKGYVAAAGNKFGPAEHQVKQIEPEDPFPPPPATRQNTTRARGTAGDRW